MKRLAPKSCIPCRDRKRKCDRTIPSCSLCYRLGRQCQYGLISPAPSSPSSEGSQSVIRSRRTSPPKLHIPSFLTGGKPTQSNLHDSLTAQLSNAVGNVSDLRSVAARYFRTIHTWLPIISENLYYERLPSIFMKPNAAISLLSLSMALITMVPDEKESESMTSLYTVVKSFIGIIEAADINTLETVQARLLVSLFESGHGIPAAYISIAATARAAAAMGINQTVNAPHSPVCEEGLRVWWGIVMLDRYYTLEHNTGPCATQDLGTPRHLPRDGNIWDQKILATNEPLPMSTPSSVRVGPFARQAQISHVVNLLILHLRDLKEGAIDNEESDQLARTLLAFSRLLPEETPQPWPRYCGAIGMCYGSLMILHASRTRTRTQSQIANHNLNPPPEDPFLTETLAGISLIATKFLARISQVNHEAISPFPPHSIMLSISAHDRMWRATGDVGYREKADLMVRMLGFFGGRWVGARKYLRMIEEERREKDFAGRWPAEVLEGR